MRDRRTRRELLRDGAALGLGILAIPGCSAQQPAEVTQRFTPPAESRVVIARDASAVKTVDGNTTVDKAKVRQLLAKAVISFTGAKTEEEAWKKLFKPTDVVGLKVNCLFGLGASTRPEVTMAVAEGIMKAGVKPENIIIWDRSNADLAKSGYTINVDGPGIRCYGTDPVVGYEDQPMRSGSFNGRLSKILTRQITALVNIPILKDHSIAGITLALKNHYGTHNNPGDHHGGNCLPAAELNSLPPIREKTRLIVADLLRPQCNGGPGLRAQFAWDYAGIMVGTDPVAVDTVGLQIIEARRKEIGLRTLEEEGRPVRSLSAAAKLGIGQGDPAKIKIVRI
ncbi:MAG: DUF362 domain-containing protein [Armatimonadota bacterium]